MLDKSSLQLNQKRWQEVAEFERAEERQRSLLERWRRLNALFGMAVGLNLAKESGFQEEEIIWNRWNKLRAIHIANGNS